MQMKEGINLGFVPKYILMFILFLFAETRTAAVPIALNMLYQHITVLDVFLLLLTLGCIFFGRIKKTKTTPQSYDDYVRQENDSLV